MLKTRQNTYLEQKILKILVHLYKILFKISFLKCKNNLFWENELSTYRNKTSQDKFQYFKIQIPVKKKIRNFLREFRVYFRLSFKPKRSLKVYVRR